MPRLLAALGTFLLLSVPAVAAQERVLTPDDVAALRSVTAAELSPDGMHVAYLLGVPRDPGVDPDGGAWTELHVADVGGERRRAFVAGEVNVSSIGWTAGGREIAFLAKRDGDEETALYVIPVDGGESRRAVKLATSIQDYDLAPDGVRVALIVAAPKDEEREAWKKKGFKQEIYEEDADPSRVWIATLDGSAEARELVFEGHPRDVRWSPVDDRLLLAWTPTTLVDDDYVRKRVAVVDAASGEVRARIENPGKLGKLEWSPDGKLVGLIMAADKNDPSAGRLALAPASGGTPTVLVPGFEGDFVDFEWQTPKALLAVTHVGVESRLEKLELGEGLGVTVRVLVSEGDPIFGSLSLAADGGSAVLTADAPAHPTELFHLRKTTPQPSHSSVLRRLTTSNPELPEFRLARQEVVQYAARDGLELQGILIHPLERAEGERVPLILTVHGGPESHYSDGWLTGYSTPGQVAAARGFAVFYPNYRGSTGRGVAFSKLGQGDAAGKEFDDLVDAVDHLVAMGLVDTDRVGVTGGSYGGFATAWCSTRYSERFAAGVMFVGISDMISKAGTTDIPDEMYLVHELKRPWEDWQDLLERSPIYHADKSKTPLLILHGKDDPRVDAGQSHELYRHLKLRGQAPVRLVLYPCEGHGNRKAAARLDYALRSLRWFEHYLKGPGGTPPDPDLDYAPAEVEADG
jgi:dipeptidyl aminopeptidase/acylaminoacyl peptidase